MLLLLRLEQQLRGHLDVLVGADEVHQLVEEWHANPELGARARALLPDDDDPLRLTWAVQDLLTERAPVIGEYVLAGVADAGGPATGTGSVVKAVRARVGDRLPGRERGTAVVPLPEELGQAGAEGVDMDDLLVGWVRRLVAERGAWTTVVVPDGTDRRRVAEFVRAQEPWVAVLSAARGWPVSTVKVPVRCRPVEGAPHERPDPSTRALAADRLTAEVHRFRRTVCPGARIAVRLRVERTPRSTRWTCPSTGSRTVLARQGPPRRHPRHR